MDIRGVIVYAVLVVSSWKRAIVLCNGGQICANPDLPQRAPLYIEGDTKNGSVVCRFQLDGLHPNDTTVSVLVISSNRMSSHSIECSLAGWCEVIFDELSFPVSPSLRICYRRHMGDEQVALTQFRFDKKEYIKPTPTIKVLAVTSHTIELRFEVPQIYDNYLDFPDVHIHPYPHRQTVVSQKKNDGIHINNLHANISYNISIRIRKRIAHVWSNWRNVTVFTPPAAPENIPHIIGYSYDDHAQGPDIFFEAVPDYFHNDPNFRYQVNRTTLTTRVTVFNISTVNDLGESQNYRTMSVRWKNYRSKFKCVKWYFDYAYNTYKYLLTWNYAEDKRRTKLEDYTIRIVWCPSKRDGCREDYLVQFQDFPTDQLYFLKESEQRLRFGISLKKKTTSKAVLHWIDSELIRIDMAHGLDQVTGLKTIDLTPENATLTWQVASPLGIQLDVVRIFYIDICTIDAGRVRECRQEDVILPITNVTLYAGYHYYLMGLQECTHYQVNVFTNQTGANFDTCPISFKTTKSPQFGAKNLAITNITYNSIEVEWEVSHCVHNTSYSHRLFVNNVRHNCVFAYKERNFNITGLISDTVYNITIRTCFCPNSADVDNGHCCVYSTGWVAARTHPSLEGSLTVDSVAMIGNTITLNCSIIGSQSLEHYFEMSLWENDLMSFRSNECSFEIPCSWLGGSSYRYRITRYRGNFSYTAAEPMSELSYTSVINCPRTQYLIILVIFVPLNSVLLLVALVWSVSKMIKNQRLSKNINIIMPSGLLDSPPARRLSVEEINCSEDYRSANESTTIE